MELFKRLCISINFYKHYKIIEDLGSGAFAKVSKIQHIKTGKYFAAKIFMKYKYIPKKNIYG